MSRNHPSGHVCGRCDRRADRLGAYHARMEPLRETPRTRAALQRAAKALRKVIAEYERPTKAHHGVEPEHLKPHWRGRRARQARNRVRQALRPFRRAARARRPA